MKTNAARQLVLAITNLTTSVVSIEERGGVYQRPLLLALLGEEAKVVGLHGLVAKRYAKLPLEVFPLSPSCTLTGIKFKETNDSFQIVEVPRVWHLRMHALQCAAQAIADQLPVVDPLHDEPVKPPKKPSRSKYGVLFGIMDEMVAKGTPVGVAAMVIAQHNAKAAKNFERLWQRRNKSLREQNQKPTDTEPA
jgi:hypothetical protein